MADKIKALHITETFTLHEIENVEGQKRPRIKQTLFEKGEVLIDKSNIELAERARDEGSIGHNHFVAIMIDPSPDSSVKIDEDPAEQPADPHVEPDPVSPEEPADPHVEPDPVSPEHSKA